MAHLKMPAQKKPEILMQSLCHLQVLDAKLLTLLGKYCGLSAKYVRGISSSVLIRFITDGSRNGKGWRLSWARESRLHGDPNIRVKGVYACFPFNKQKFGMEMLSGLLARFYKTLMV